MATPQRTKVLLGEAGEHLVLSQLLLRGYVASQAPRAWKADDILIEGGMKIQVKTTSGSTRKGWMVGKVVPEPDRVYALVLFHQFDAHVFVVPSAVVYEAAERSDRAGHRLHPGHAQIGMRKVQDPFPHRVRGYPPGWLAHYEGRWEDALGAPDQ